MGQRPSDAAAMDAHEAWGNDRTMQRTRQQQNESNLNQDDIDLKMRKGKVRVKKG